jgi:pimeloyl-ACP methyl ester carboxylesterase
MDWFNELQRRSASPKNAARLQRVLSKFDVTDLLARVSVPTLVVHARDDMAVPFFCGEELAEGIPGARLVAVDSRNHILLEDEPAWHDFVRATREFLGIAPRDASVAAQPKPPEPKDELRSCISLDGTKIAYATRGEGFPIVKAPNAATQLELDRDNPIFGHWVRELSRRNRLVRFDMRGFGLSQWKPEHFTMDSQVEDLATVVDASGLEQFDLVGLTHGAAIAIDYAARYPERVRKLILLNSFSCGWAVRADPAEIAWRRSLMELNRTRWRRENVLLGERFMSLYFPTAAAEIVEWHSGRIDRICTAESIERMLEWGSRIDVRGDLPQVRAETLVIHAAHDGNAPLEVGREVADAIAGARFVEIDSANHVTLEDELAWPVVVREIRAFLDSASERTEVDAPMPAPA